MIAWVLACMCLLLMVAVFLMWRRIEFLTDEAADACAHEHAKCLAHIGHLVSDEFAARILEQAAADWDAPEGVTHMKVLARLKYQAGGPSMPNIWLRDRAARLRKIEELSHE